MTKLDALLDEYEKSHRHPVNILIHWIAEPLAIFALMALAYSVALFGVALLWPFLAVMLIYFAALSLHVALAFVPVVILFVVLIGWIAAAVEMPTWQWALPLFMMCWFALLGGHKIEGHVPSVFQNPNLIFVGPAWLMRRIFRRIGISKL